MRLVISSFILLNSLLLVGQDLEGSEREQFVVEQEQYLAKLKLSDNQKRRYFAKIREFQKLQQNILNSRLSDSERHKRLKLVEKNRDDAMKGILSKSQFSIFAKRQKEIKKKYGNF